MQELRPGKRPAVSVLALLLLNFICFSVQADDSADSLIPGSEIHGPPGDSEPEFRFEQSLGTGYSSERGFLVLYRIEAQGRFWSLNNDFGFLLDRLSFNLRQGVEVNDHLSVAAEAPMTLEWQVPTNFAFNYAGLGRINLHSRRDRRDERPGWSFLAEATMQANGQDRVSDQIASFAPSPLSSSASSRHRAGFITEATFFNGFLTPSFGVSGYYDLGSPTPTEVMVSGSLAHNWGSPDQKTKLSVFTPVVSTSTVSVTDGPNREQTRPSVSSRVVIEQGWGRWMGRFELSSIGSVAFIGYKF